MTTEPLASPEAVALVAKYVDAERGVERAILHSYGDVAYQQRIKHADATRAALLAYIKGLEEK